MPNVFAYVMLAIWPLVIVAMFRHLPLRNALVWAVVSAYLILPPVAKLDLPVVPDLDKYSLPNLTIAYAILFVLRKQVDWLPDGLVGKGLVLLYVLSPFGTILTNPDVIPYAMGAIPGLKIYDAFSTIAYQIFWILPFVFGRQFLGDPAGLRVLTRVLAIAGLAYSIPMLIEIRLSPQMNVWIYGFFQHDFFQTIRYGGYRPVVFLPHGLWVAVFTLTSMMCALLLLRIGPADRRPKALAAMLYLLFMLVLCKSAGVLAYAVALCPLILLFRPRFQIMVAGALAVIVLVYPLLRGLHLVPLDQILQFSNSLSPDRAYSLNFRIQNEEMLLLRAEERPWFGWGSYGRNFMHDPVTGKMINIADGQWIITLGMYGWSGFIANFGLSVLPLLLLMREAWLGRAEDITRMAAGWAMILSASVLDMLPNATQVPLTWLMTGALLGEAERLRALRTSRQRPLVQPAMKTVI